MTTLRQKRNLMRATFETFHELELDEIIPAEDIISIHNRVSHRLYCQSQPNPAIAAMKKFKTHTVHATRLGPDGENLYEPYRK